MSYEHRRLSDERCHILQEPILVHTWHGLGLGSDLDVGQLAATGALPARSLHDGLAEGIGDAPGVEFGVEARLLSEYRLLVAPPSRLERLSPERFFGRDFEPSSTFWPVGVPEGVRGNARTGTPNRSQSVSPWS